MSNLTVHIPPLPAMSEWSVAKVREFEAVIRDLPQQSLTTLHVLHGGMYARTIMIPAGVVLTGALIKIPTMVIVSGDVTVYVGDETIELHGYNALPASVGRKQVFLAKSDTWVTMLFPSDAASVEEAEAQFTDETDLLASKQDMCKNVITITGE